MRPKASPESLEAGIRAASAAAAAFVGAHIPPRGRTFLWKAGLCPYAIAPFAALPFARSLPQSRRRPHVTYSEVPKNYLCQPRAGTDSTPVALPAQDFFPPTVCIPYGYRLAVP